MKLTDPNLTLIYTSDNTTATTRDIEQDSVEMAFQLYSSDLAPSSDTITLNLLPGTTASRIISEVEDIKATFKDGSTTIYTGYLAKEYSWTVGLTGEEVLKLTLEGVGTHFLGKTLVDEDDSSIHDTALAIVNSIITRCGGAFSLETPTASVLAKLAKTLTNTVSSSDTCQDILNAICFELGLVYSFNASGNLVITETNLTSSPSRTFWADNSSHTSDGSLYTYSSTAIALTRQARQYKQVKVSYDRLKDSTGNVDVYKVSETIQVPGGQWWDGATHSEDIYDLTLDEWFLAGKTYYTHDSTGYHVASVTVGDPVPADTYYEYAGQCSTVELSDLTEGKDIVYVYPASVFPNAAARTTAEPGYVETTTGFGSSKWTLRPHGNTNKIDVLIDNTLGATSVFYSKFQAKARIITKQATCNVYRSADALTANSEAQYDYQASWIHEQSDAVALADLLNSYFLYANNTYVFYTDEDLALGSIVSIKDNVHSGLDVNVFLTAKACTGTRVVDGVFRYTGQAVSAFSVRQKTRLENNVKQVSVATDGQDGKAFLLLTSAVNYIRNARLSGNQTITLSTQVSGYTGTPTLAATAYTGSTPTVLTITDNTISVPYTNAYDRIEITATLTGAPTQTLNLLPDAATATNVFLGVRNTLPTETPAGELIIDGDWFVVGATDISSAYPAGSAWSYLNSTWVELTDANKLLVCLKNLKSTGVDLSEISDANAVSWFNTLVADKGIFDLLLAQNLTVNTNGRIESDGVELDNQEEYPVNTGFVLGADGLIHANGAYITNINAVNGTYTGDFISTAFEAVESRATELIRKDEGDSVQYADIHTAVDNLSAACIAAGTNTYGTVSDSPTGMPITAVRNLDSSVSIVSQTISSSSGSMGWTAPTTATMRFTCKNPFKDSTSGRSYAWIYINGELFKKIYFIVPDQQTVEVPVSYGDSITYTWDAQYTTDSGYLRIRSIENGFNVYSGSWLTVAQYKAEMTGHPMHSTWGAIPYGATGMTVSGFAGQTLTVSYGTVKYAFQPSIISNIGNYKLLTESGATTGSDVEVEFTDFNGTSFISLRSLGGTESLSINSDNIKVLTGTTVSATIPTELYTDWTFSASLRKDTSVQSKSIIPMTSTETLGNPSNHWDKAYIGGVEYNEECFKLDGNVLELANGWRILKEPHTIPDTGLNKEVSISFTTAGVFTEAPFFVYIMSSKRTGCNSSYTQNFSIYDITSTGFTFWIRDTKWPGECYVIAIGK